MRTRFFRPSGCWKSAVGRTSMTGCWRCARLLASDPASDESKPRNVRRSEGSMITITYRSLTQRVPYVRFARRRTPTLHLNRSEHEAHRIGRGSRCHGCWGVQEGRAKQYDSAGRHLEDDGDRKSVG